MITLVDVLPPSSPFPVARESTKNPGLIVLFTDSKKGVVIQQGSGPFKVGYTTDGWVPVDDTAWKCVSVTISG